MSVPATSNRWPYIFALIASYCIIIIQYLYNRSVWNDEAYLAITITNVGFRDLLLPLDYYQAAPILFLQIEKLATVLFGHSEYALRLFPLLSALAAIPLFYSFCIRFTGNRLLSLLALMLLAVTPGFIYYSSEIKQYCIDLFVAVLLYNLAFNNAIFFIKRRTFILSIAGFIAVFLSNVAVVILFTLGLYFLFITWQSKKIRREHLVPAVVWVIGFGANYVLFIKDHPNAEYMRNYWQFAFMPINILDSSFWTFAGSSIHRIFSQLLPSLPWGNLYLATLFLFLTGLFGMFREKRFLLLYLCVAPVIIHLGLSAFRLYPFEQRMVLYHAPLYVLSMIFGLFWIVKKLPVDNRWRIVIASLSVALIACKTFMNYPMKHDEIKSAIKYINEAHKAGESMYVASGAVPGIRYYRQRGLARVDDLRIELGKQKVDDISAYLENIDKVHGHLWLVVSDVFPFKNNYEEEMAVVAAIKQRGKLISEKDFIGSTVYLYEIR